MSEKKTVEKAPSTAASPEAMSKVEQLIESVESVYQNLTGSAPPADSGDAFAPIPVERDPAEFVGEQLERLLGELASPMITEAERPWRPPAAFGENDRECLLALDLPGVAREEVEINLFGSAVNVRGRRPPGLEPMRLQASERPAGAFERTIVLPARVDLDSASARLRDGVLEIRFAKRGRDATGRREVRIA